MERKPTRFELRLPPNLADEIDSWRREVVDLPPRAEAARRLIELGLAVYRRAEAKEGTPEFDQANSAQYRAYLRAKGASS